MGARSLLLLRHAKWSWDDPALADFDRPLARRGREAAPRIAREMARRGWLPDAALVSPAARTRETWALAAGHLGNAPASFDPDIYEAPAERILAAIRKTGDEIASLLVVGHNPGLQELSTQLASHDSDDQALTRLTTKFPTAAVARFSFEGRWHDLAGARLEAFVTVREL